MRKFILPAFAVLVSLLALSTLSSCNEELDGMDPAIELYQQYEVIVTDKAKAAYANFRIGSAAGERVQLTDGSWIMMNAMSAYYQQSISATDPEFNYITVLDSLHKSVNFVFHRAKDKDIVNSVSIADLPSVEIPDSVESVENGSPVPLELGSVNPMNIDVILSSESLTGSVYHAQYTPVGFVFNSVPAGNYTLVADYVKVTPTENNDGKAGGSITVIRRKFRNLVTVR